MLGFLAGIFIKYRFLLKYPEALSFLMNELPMEVYPYLVEHFGLDQPGGMSVREMNFNMAKAKPFAAVLKDGDPRNFLVESLRVGQKAGPAWEQLKNMTPVCSVVLRDKDMREFLVEQLGLGFNQINQLKKHVRFALIDKEVRSFLVERLHFGQEGGLSFGQLNSKSSDKVVSLIRDQAVCEVLIESLGQLDHQSLWDRLNALPNRVLSLLKNPGMRHLLVRRLGLSLDEINALPDEILSLFEGKATQGFLVHALHLVKEGGLTLERLRSPELESFRVAIKLPFVREYFARHRVSPADLMLEEWTMDEYELLMFDERARSMPPHRLWLNRDRVRDRIEQRIQVGVQQRAMTPLQQALFQGREERTEGEARVARRGMPKRRKPSNRLARRTCQREKGRSLRD